MRFAPLFIFLFVLSAFTQAKSVYNIPYVITDAETIYGEVKVGTKVSGDDKENVEFPIPFHYTDEYFAEPSYYYNPSLASLSCCMAISSYNSILNYSSEEPYFNKSHNLQDFFQQIGIPESNYDVSESYRVPPLNNTVGCIVGHKSIHVADEDYTLVVVGIRSGGYETEWVGNVFLGEDGDHLGFSLAQQYVMERIRAHVQKLTNPGKIKFWVAGYSRGGATSNLVGAALDQDPTLGGTVDCSRDHIYVYCIEPATGANISETTKASEEYANIFSLVNPADVVPYVAPTELGFRRYGKDLFLPAPETSSAYAELSKKMTDLYHSLESTKDDPLLIDDFTVYKLPFLTDDSKKGNGLIPKDKNDNSSQAYFLRRLIPAVCSLVGTRENYAKNYQSYFMELMYIFKKSPLADIVQCEDQIVNEVLAPTLLKAALGKKINTDKIAQKIGEIVNKTLHVAEVVDPVIHVLPLAAKLVWHEPNLVATLIYALGTIGHAHYPEVTIAWLMLMDPMYAGDQAVPLENCFTQGYYRLLQVSGTVDVEAFSAQANGPLVSITNNVTSSADSFRAPHGIDSNENKYLSFPADHEYSVTITAREDTTLVVNLQAFSPFTGGCVRNIHYDDVTLAANDTLTITIPVITEAEIGFNFSAATATQYELKTSKLTTVKPTSQLYAKEALRGVFSVTATAENNQTGFVVGSGEQNYGESVLVRAVPYEDYEFVEWVDAQGEVVSTDPLIRVTVTSDIVLSARFTEAPKSESSFLSHPYIVIGASVGAFVLLLAAAICTFCLCRSRCKKQAADDQEMAESVEYNTFNSESQNEQEMA